MKINPLKYVLGLFEPPPTPRCDRCTCELTPAQCAALVALVKGSDNATGICERTQEWLSERARMSVRSVQRAYDELEAKGWIRRSGEPGDPPDANVKRRRKRKPVRRSNGWCETTVYELIRVPGCLMVQATDCHVVHTTNATQSTRQTRHNPHDKLAQSSTGGSTRSSTGGRARASAPPQSPSVSGQALPLPDDWTPNDEHRAFAAEHEIDLERAVERFKLGGPRKNMDAAFGRWLFDDRDDPRAKLSAKTEAPTPPYYEPCAPEPERGPRATPTEIDAILGPMLADMRAGGARQ